MAYLVTLQTLPEKKSEGVFCLPIANIPFLLGLYVTSSIRCLLGDQKYPLPTRFSFLSPKVSPEISPPAVLNLMMVPFWNYTLKSPSLVPVPLFIPIFILDSILPT